MYARSCLLLCLFLHACGDPSSPKVDSISPLQALFEAHGGLAHWQSFQTLSFTIESHSPARTTVAQHVVDLHTRHERIKGPGYQLGFDGSDYWEIRSDTSLKKMDAKFLVNLQFYFFAMPFVLADPGVKAESTGSKQLNGKTYDVYQITFEQGTGVASDDQYIVYVDQQTGRLEILLYSVTYYNKDNAEKFNALHYTDWQKVNGLLLPVKASRHFWDQKRGALGDKRGEKIYRDVELATAAPPVEIFQKRDS